LVIYQATGARLLNLLEVAFSYGGVNLPSSSLTFKGSSYHNNIVGGITFGAAALANDGSLTTCFHTSTIDTNPTLRVAATNCFDKLTIYRRTDCCINRLDGAVLTIYADAGGQQVLFTYVFPINTPAVTTLTLASPICPSLAG